MEKKNNEIIKNNIKYGCYLCGIDEDQKPNNKILDRNTATYQIPIRVPPLHPSLLKPSSQSKPPSSS